MNNREINQVEKLPLTEEAQKHLKRWNHSKDLIFFKEKGPHNWGLAYDPERGYFLSLSIKPGCKSTNFGDWNHVKRIYPRITENKTPEVFILEASKEQLMKMQQELSREIKAGILKDPKYLRELRLIESRIEKY